MLLEASRSSSKEEPPTVIADGGVENVNHPVDELISSGLLRRVLAMTELRFSNDRGPQRGITSSWMKSCLFGSFDLVPFPVSEPRRYRQR